MINWLLSMLLLSLLFSFSFFIIILHTLPLVQVVLYIERGNYIYYMPLVFLILKYRSARSKAHFDFPWEKCCQSKTQWLQLGLHPGLTCYGYIQEENQKYQKQDMAYSRLLLSLLLSSSKMNLWWFGHLISLAVFMVDVYKMYVISWDVYVYV